MKKTYLIFLLVCGTSLLKAQVRTKTMDSYSVKFIVAEKVPEQLNFLMGTYKDETANKTIQLKNDGTVSLDGKNYKYWFECTDDNFIAKMPYLDRSLSEKIPLALRSKYSLISLIVEQPYKLQTSMNDSIIINNPVWHVLVSIEEKKGIINHTYSKEITGNWQEFNVITKNGPIAPLRTKAKEMCDCISIQEKPTGEDKQYFDYNYEKRLMDFVGVDITKESRESATEKISKWWYKYKTLFYCQSSTFNVEFGNILKFAVAKGFAPFLETIVGTYQMDINFIDPVDNRNVLDYVIYNLDKTIKIQGAGHQQVKVLKEYKDLIEDLGGKPSGVSNVYNGPASFK